MFKTGEVSLNPEMKEKMEKIDRIKEETMKYAEKCCRKIHMGEVIFSPTLNNLGKIWGLWGLVRNVKEGNKINKARIKRKAILLGLRNSLFLTI